MFKRKFHYPLGSRGSKRLEFASRSHPNDSQVHVAQICSMCWTDEKNRKLKKQRKSERKKRRNTLQQGLSSVSFSLFSLWGWCYYYPTKKNDKGLKLFYITGHFFSLIKWYWATVSFEKKTHTQTQTQTHTHSLSLWRGSFHVSLLFPSYCSVLFYYVFSSFFPCFSVCFPRK